MTKLINLLLLVLLIKAHIISVVVFTGWTAWLHILCLHANSFHFLIPG